MGECVWGGGGGQGGGAGTQGARPPPDARTFLTVSIKPSFRAEFRTGEGVDPAGSMARGVDTRGERGP